MPGTPMVDESSDWYAAAEEESVPQCYRWRRRLDGEAEVEGGRLRATTTSSHANHEYGCCDGSNEPIAPGGLAHPFTGNHYSGGSAPAGAAASTVRSGAPSGLVLGRWSWLPVPPA